jgi:hypothetical protein
VTTQHGSRALSGPAGSLGSVAYLDQLSNKPRKRSKNRRLDQELEIQFIDESKQAGESSVYTAIKNQPRSSQSKLQTRLLTALDETSADWRTVESLGDEVGATVRDVELALAALRPVVRRPVAAKGDEFGLYRISTRGKTWREWVRVLLMAAGGVAYSRGRE